MHQKKNKENVENFYKTKQKYRAYKNHFVTKNFGSGAYRPYNIGNSLQGLQDSQTSLIYRDNLTQLKLKQLKYSVLTFYHFQAFLCIYKIQMNFKKIFKIFLKNGEKDTHFFFPKEIHRIANCGSSAYKGPCTEKEPHKK